MSSFISYVTEQNHLSPEAADALSKLSDKLFRTRESILGRLLHDITEEVDAARNHRASTALALHSQMRSFLDLDAFLHEVDRATERSPASAPLTAAMLADIASNLIAYKTKFPALMDWLEIAAVIEHGAVRSDLEDLAKGADDPHARIIRQQRSKGSGWLRGFGKRDEA